MQYEALVLGVAQDGSVPHMGCECKNCSNFSMPGKEQFAVSLALIQKDEKGAGKVWLIDCGPDVKAQWRMLARHLSELTSWSIEGVFITHLHMGHYIGLHQFGKEACKQPNGLPIFASPSICNWLERTEPWRLGLSDGIFRCIPMSPLAPFILSDGLSITPILVPHRMELGTDTVCFSIQGPDKKILWLPDIDSWSGWDLDVRSVVEEHSISFLDACFWSAVELKRRDMGEIPHPLVVETMDKLEGLGHRVKLIHLNHTNPLWDKESEEHRRMVELGFETGFQGEVVSL